MSHNTYRFVVYQPAGYSNTGKMRILDLVEIQAPHLPTWFYKWGRSIARRRLHEGTETNWALFRAGELVCGIAPEGWA